MATPVPNPLPVRFGAFEADLRTGELRKHGIRIKLQDQPFQILAMLLENPGELVARDAIRQRLWPADTFVDFDHSLNTAVARLREALGDSAENPRWIETLPRRGYRFLGQVQGAVVPIRESASAPAAAVETVVGSRMRREAWAALIIAVLAVAAIAAWRFWPRPAKIDSVAVLPFANETGDKSLDYLGDGLAEALIENLADIPGLRVSSRNSAFQMRRANLSVRELAQRLNVRAVLVGTLRRDGDQVRISTELVDAADDRHVWGEQYNVRPQQFWAFQSTVARQLSQALRFKLDGSAEARLNRRSPRNSVAYDAYLHGRFALRQRTKLELQQAIEFFQRAIELDPEYALAYAGLGDAYSISAYNGNVSPLTALPIGDAASQRALRLAPELAQVHVSVAYQLANTHRDLAGALAEAKRALAIDPNSADAVHAYGEFLGRMGRMDEALEQRRIGMVLDPQWPLAKIYYYIVLCQLGRLKEAEQIALRSPAGAHNNNALATVRVLQGRFDEAMQAFDPDFSHAGPALVGYHLLALSRTGHRDQVQAMLADLLERRKRAYVSASLIGIHYLVLGDKEKAIAWFGTAVDEYDMLFNYAGQDPLYDPLRNDPRFQKLMEKLRTPV